MFDSNVAVAFYLKQLEGCAARRKASVFQDSQHTLMFRGSTCSSSFLLNVLPYLPSLYSRPDAVSSFMVTNLAFGLFLLPPIYFSLRYRHLEAFFLNFFQNSFPFCAMPRMKVGKFQYHLTPSQAQRGCFLKPRHSQQLFFPANPNELRKLTSLGAQGNIHSASQPLPRQRQRVNSRKQLLCHIF